MGNKKTILKVNDLCSKLNNIKTKLSSTEDINISDVLNITDTLEEISITSSKIENQSQNIFTKSGIKDIEEDIKKLFGRIEEIENKRQVNDENILSKLHKILYLEDYLELNFFQLNPCDIDLILSYIEEELKTIFENNPYNNKIISPLTDEIKNKFQNLKFRYNFPIVEELDEKKNSYAHRLLMIADELKNKDPKEADFLIKKIDDLSDLVWIAKMFMYRDFKSALSIFDRLDNNLKDKIEKTIWKIKGEKQKQIEVEKKEAYSKALMNYVADEINA